MKVDLCLCARSFSLQVNLINHLLSHIPKQFFERSTFAEPLVVTKQEPDEDSSNSSDDDSSDFDWSDFKDDGGYRFRRISRPNKPAINIKTRVNSKRCFECDLCLFKCGSKNDLGKHIGNVHTKRKPNADNSEIRKRRPRNDMTGKVRCKQCTAYLLPGSMSQHIFNYHNKSSGFACDHPGCDARFLRHAALLTHLDRHKGIKKLICQFCGEKFYEKGNLNKHLLRHTEPEKFKCEQCGKIYSSEGALQFHLRTHIADDGTRPYACEECNAVFKFPNLLKNHVKRCHTGERTKTSVKLEFLILIFFSFFWIIAERVDAQCELCPFVARTLINLKGHMYKKHKVRTRSKMVFDRSDSI